MNARILLLALVVALPACREAHRVKVLPTLHTEIKDEEAPPPEAVVTERLVYERTEVTRERLDVAEDDARVELDPAFLGALRPHPLLRIVQVSDVQLREERARLKGADRELSELPGASLVTPVEETTRPPLLAANSAFMWLGLVLTVNELHARAPVDLTLHTGDATDVNLRTELVRFLEIADRLETPTLMVAGNHDVLGWGVWRRDQPVYGTVLDDDVDFESPAVEAVFLANRDELIQAPQEHRVALDEILARLGPHPPTLERFGTRDLGYDLGPTPEALYYTVELLPPARGVRPGVQLIVLETNRDDGGADAHVDAAQLAWLRGVLEAPATRENIVIVTGHHPLVGEDPNPLVNLFVVPELDPVRQLLLQHPNMVAYLTGHTHVPEIHELEAADGALGIVQINPGAILVRPQTAALLELSLEGADLVIDARRFGAMIAPGSKLAAHLAESRAAAAEAREPQHGPKWDVYRGVKRLPTFPVQ